MIGILSQRCSSSADETGRFTSAIWPFGFRTATDQAVGLRIMTPSRTAWPPIGALMASVPRVTLGASGLFEPALEALDAAARIHELLLARVEGVALRADLDVQLRLRGACLELVATGAANGRDDVLGMNVSLHLNSG